jgi:hypothetical protein
VRPTTTAEAIDSLSLRERVRVKGSSERSSLGYDRRDNNRRYEYAKRKNHDLCRESCNDEDE